MPKKNPNISKKKLMNSYIASIEKQLDLLVNAEEENDFELFKYRSRCMLMEITNFELLCGFNSTKWKQ